MCNSKGVAIAGGSIFPATLFLRAFVPQPGTVAQPSLVETASPPRFRATGTGCHSAMRSFPASRL
jgi:hypothetical protein